MLTVPAGYDSQRSMQRRASTWRRRAGLRNLATMLALELAEKNINVNNIAPGMVLTPVNQEARDDPEVRKKQVQSIPMMRAAEPEEIAHVAVFLASDKARYIVDGALMLFQGQGA